MHQLCLVAAHQRLLTILNSLPTCLMVEGPLTERGDDSADMCLPTYYLVAALGGRKNPVLQLVGMLQAPRAICQQQDGQVALHGPVVCSSPASSARMASVAYNPAGRRGVHT